VFQKLSEPPICILGDGSAPIIWQGAICRDEIDDSLQLGLVVAVDHDHAHLVVVEATIRNTLYDLSQERVVGDWAERPLLPRKRIREERTASPICSRLRESPTRVRHLICVRRYLTNEVKGLEVELLLPDEKIASLAVSEGVLGGDASTAYYRNGIADPRAISTELYPALASVLRSRLDLLKQGSKLAELGWG
jgi:hypothetical protein